MPHIEPSLTRYEVSVLVENSKLKGAPVIIESNPTYPNLFGRIEKQAQFGTLFTDFTMIKPGALHRANGGYLIIKAIDLLRSLGSWDALKRAIKSDEIRIEDPKTYAHSYGYQGGIDRQSLYISSSLFLRQRL